MKTKLPIFSAYGVELEYMIVDRDTLAVSPITDQLICDVAGQIENEVQFDHLAWSNELVLHVIELKTNGPAASLSPLADYFHHDVCVINKALEKYHATLMPTGCHPLMDPMTEAKLWPHGDKAIYRAYDRIFDCRGHGWANLQSAHLNLPFANDEEFFRLHTAIRLILPLIPALSASTPIIDGKLTGIYDTRLAYNETNQQKMPSVTGQIIPEVVFSEHDYHEKIFKKMYAEIAPHDPDNILQEEWLNSRGAIARFCRNTIEIRVTDIQECPKADLAIVSFVVALLKCMVDEKWQVVARQTHWSEERLKKIFMTAVKEGMSGVIDDEDYPTLFGLEKGMLRFRDVLAHLNSVVWGAEENGGVETSQLIHFILKNGNLSERIVMALENRQPLRTHITEVYQALSTCLKTNTLFLPHCLC